MPFAELPALVRQFQAADPEDRVALRRLVNRTRQLRDRFRNEDASELAFCLNAAANLTAAIALPGERLPRTPLHMALLQVLEQLEACLTAFQPAPSSEAMAPTEVAIPEPQSHAPVDVPAPEPLRPAIELDVAATATDPQRIEVHAPTAAEPAPCEAHAGGESLGTPEEFEDEIEGVSPAVGLRLGQMLIELGHATKDDVAAALKMQETIGLPIGECMLLSGTASPDHLLHALKLQEKLRSQVGACGDAGAGDDDGQSGPSGERADLKVTQEMFLGEALLGAGMITEEELEKAMHMHHHDDVRVGDALLRLGALSEEDLAAGIEMHQRLRKIATISSADAAQRKRGR